MMNQKGNKSTKNHNEVQMTKRRKKDELIKKTAPCTKGKKPATKQHHMQSLEKSTNGWI